MNPRPYERWAWPVVDEWGYQTEPARGFPPPAGVVFLMHGLYNTRTDAEMEG